jgi:hypothetical protein
MTCRCIVKDKCNRGATICRSWEGVAGVAFSLVVYPAGAALNLEKSGRSSESCGLSLLRRLHAKGIGLGVEPSAMSGCGG